jgi:TPR repeat protein
LIFTLLLTVVFVALVFVPGARASAHLAWTFGGVAAFLLCWQAWLFMLWRRKKINFAWDFVAVRSHYVQALVQLSVYACWGWYWRGVFGEAPLILSQVAFLYVFDALLTWSRRQTWRLGFGPWPIIFSTNLFLWFRDDWFVFQFLMVAIGVLGKQFIRWRRGGKLTHIFNPSAFGLTVVSLVLIFTGTSEHTWGGPIAASQDYAPHLFTVIFLGGLVVQYFFSVTLLTFSAAAMLCLLGVAYTKITGVYAFYDTNIPTAVFLGMHLLMTDPATTPRSSLGKAIFGSLYGACVFLGLMLLSAFHAPLFYDKLLVVPVLNLLVPLLDRLGALGAAGNFGRWEARVGPRKMNLAYMGGWVALFATMAATGFVEAPHPGRTLAFWKKAAEEKRPRAADQLRHILDVLNRPDLTPDERLPVAGVNPGLTREQALGRLYDQVALIYGEGKLVPADPAKAAFNFKKACEYGDMDGCVNFAVGYFRRNRAGAPEEIQRALSTLEQSGAASTNGKVCYILGFAYDTGRGRPLNNVKARQLLEKGAALGESAAWPYLAYMQLTGRGGPPDPAAAALWFQKAVDANDGPSCLYLAQMYLKGNGVGLDGQKAAALLEKACNLGVAQACDMLKAADK